MKRIEELTKEELVALTDEQFKLVLDYECAFAGIAKVECPVNPDKNDLVKKEIRAYRFNGFVFKNKDDALAMRALFEKCAVEGNLLKAKYDYSISYDHEWLEVEEKVPEVEEVHYATEQEVRRNKDRIKNFDVLKNAYEKECDIYRKYQNERDTFASILWNKKREAQEHFANIDRLKKAWQEYLLLANNKVEIALVFFNKAYPSIDNDLKELVGVPLEIVEQE